MKSLLAVCILSVLIPLIAGCDPMTSVTFVNETQEELQFYEQASAQSSLAAHKPVSAGSAYEYKLIPAGYTWERFAATREDGQWIFDHAYTRDELEKAKRRIVVSSLEPIAPPVDVRVIPYPGAPRPVLSQATPNPAPALTATPGQTVR